MIVIRVALGISSDNTVHFNNPSLTQIVVETECGQPARPALISAMRTMDTGSTDDSGPTLATERDRDLVELKSFDLDFDGLAIAV